MNETYYRTPFFSELFREYKMSQYPIAHDPADNATLRQKYLEGHGLPLRMAHAKDNGVPTGGLWLMQNTDANSARYVAPFDSEHVPTTNIEAFERAGATFYPHCV
jgi:hypothetical protein